MRRAVVLLLLVALDRPGVSPETPWSCPATHPVKGYLADTGLRIYHVPGSPFYEEASPERCYASEEDARRDGARPARAPARRWPPDDRA